MALPVPNKHIHKPKGRPKGSGKLKDPDAKAKIPWRVSQQLVDIVNQEKTPSETYSEATYRLIVQKNHKIGNLQKKVDALEQRLQQAQLYLKFDTPILNDYCETK